MTIRAIACTLLAIGPLLKAAPLRYEDYPASMTGFAHLDLDAADKSAVAGAVLEAARAYAGVPASSAQGFEKLTGLSLNHDIRGVTLALFRPVVVARPSAIVYLKCEYNSTRLNRALAGAGAKAHMLAGRAWYDAGEVAAVAAGKPPVASGVALCAYDDKTLLLAPTLADLNAALPLILNEKSFEPDAAQKAVTRPNPLLCVHLSTPLLTSFAPAMTSEPGKPSAPPSVTMIAGRLDESQGKVRAHVAVTTGDKATGDYIAAHAANFVLTWQKAFSIDRPDESADARAGRKLLAKTLDSVRFLAQPQLVAAEASLPSDEFLDALARVKPRAR